MYKKILVPLDGSPLAEAVLPHAQALAKSEGAEIVILRVPVPPSFGIPRTQPQFGKQDPLKIQKRKRRPIWRPKPPNWRRKASKVTRHHDAKDRSQI